MWHTLARNLAEEQALLGERITGSALSEMYDNGRAVIKTHQGTIVAFAALWKTADPSWHELGSVWVCKSHRNHGLGSKVFLECANILSRRVFLITHNPKVVHLALKAGLSEADTHTWLRVPFSISCDPCDRTQCRRTCPLRATHDCRLFFK